MKDEPEIGDNTNRKNSLTPTAGELPHQDGEKSSSIGDEYSERLTMWKFCRRYKEYKGKSEHNC